MTSEVAPTGRPPTRRLVLNVADLRRRLGQRRDQPIELVVAEQVVVDTRTLPEPVVGSVTVESIERGVSVLGEVTMGWEGACRRCLEPVVGTADVTIDEIFQVGAPPDSDLIDFDGDQIDLVPVVTDAVALSLPLAPLCRPDCPGPDPDRYPARTEAELAAAEAAEGPAIDPRWQALDELDLT